MTTEKILQTQSWSRRAFLRGAAGVGVAGTAALILAACGGTAAPASSSAPASSPAASSKPATSVAASPASASASTTSPSASAAAAASKPAASTSAASSPAASGAATSAAPTGTLRYAVDTFGTESFDPIVGSGSAWLWAMCDQLITHDSSGKYIGNLADTFDVSSDGLTWTFHLHKGVKFHNGDPFTSADVLFSFQHYGDKSSTNPWSPYIIANSTDISAPDDYTVVYKLKAPELSIREPITQMPILPKNYFAKVGPDGFQKAPVGTGAWKFNKYVPKTTVVMDANPDYWGPTKPQWAQVVETLVPDESTRIAQLQRGEVDIISSAITPDNLISLKDKGFKLQPIGLPGLLNISFSGTFWTKNPISDINVRRAMSYAINRDEFSKTYFKGLAKPGGFWFWSDLTWAHDVDPTSWEPPKNDLLVYDVNKAKQLLQQAGFPGKFNPQTITLFCEAGPVSDQMQILQGYWQKIGLQVEIKVVDAAVYTGRIFQRAKDPSGDIVGQIWPWGPGGPFPSFFNNVYHSANMFTSKGVHTTSNDPKADDLYQAAVHEPDETKSKKMWNDFMHYGYDTLLVNMPVVQYPFNVVAGPKVGDFTQFSYGAIQQAYVGITHGKG